MAGMVLWFYLIFYEMYENIDHCPGTNQTHGLVTIICTVLLKITCIKYAL